MSSSSNISDYDYVWIVVQRNLGVPHNARNKFLSKLSECNHKPTILLTNEEVLSQSKTDKVSQRLHRLNLTPFRYDHCRAVPRCKGTTQCYASRVIPSQACQCSGDHRYTKGNDATITIGCTSLSSLMTPSEPNTLNKTTAKDHSASFAATESTSGPDFNYPDRNYTERRRRRQGRQTYANNSDSCHPTPTESGAVAGERLCSSSSESASEPLDRPDTSCTTAYPTESRMLQKEREKQRVAAGLEKTTFKRYKHVEEHYDDCGDDTNILEKALVDTNAYHADDESEPETAASGISSFMMLESLSEKLPTSVAVMENMNEFTTYLSKVPTGIDIAEICGEAGKKGRLSVRRHLNTGTNYDMTVNVDLSDPVQTQQIKNYIALQNVSTVILSPSDRSPYPTYTSDSDYVSAYGAWEQAYREGAIHEKLCGQIALIQLN